jgi:hypothetical protein
MQISRQELAMNRDGSAPIKILYQNEMVALQLPQSLNAILLSYQDILDLVRPQWQKQLKKRRSDEGLAHRFRLLKQVAEKGTWASGVKATPSAILGSISRINSRIEKVNVVALSENKKAMDNLNWLSQQTKNPIIQQAAMAWLNKINEEKNATKG